MVELLSNTMRGSSVGTYRSHACNLAQLKVCHSH